MNKRGQQKPLVKFNRLVGWNDRDQYGVTATLGGVTDHPRLGMQDTVYTSQVLGIEYDAEGFVKRIETLNTIYEKSS